MNYWIFSIRLYRPVCQFDILHRKSLSNVGTKWRILTALKILTLFKLYFAAFFAERLTKDRSIYYITSCRGEVVRKRGLASKYAFQNWDLNL